jgi:hypothetical protein
MVEGLDRFREHFRDHTHQFVLIGGTACDLIMEEAGLGFRATRDLDIVLQVELLEPEFFSSFWDFVRMGEYRIQQAESGKPRFYRFAAPDQPGYPSMLELFSVRPDVLTPQGKGHLTPIPAGGLVSSLSAILLDDTYYSFLKNGIRSIDAVPIVGQEHLLPLKVRAWLEMTARKKDGERVDSRAIRKHRNDVFRLSAVVDPTFSEAVPAVVRDDVRRFLASMRSETLNLKSLGISGDLETVLGQLGSMYVRD